MTPTHGTGPEGRVRDDDRLARVTFLPGVVPPSITDTVELASLDRESGQDTAKAAADKAEAKAHKRAVNVSMHALTRRDMSRWELEKTLTSRGLDPEQIRDEVTRLESVGLIDDAALAETIVRTQHERKGLGRSALVAELRRRHVDQHHIDTALESLDAADELARALELAHRRAPQLTSLDRATAVRRLSGFLMRKGYSSNIVRTAVDEALSGMRTSVRFR